VPHFLPQNLRRILLFIFLVVCAGAVRGERLPAKLYTSADGLGTSAAFKLVRDARGFVWICSRDGLIRFDGYQFLTYRIGNEADDPTVFSLLPTRRGAYWIDLNNNPDYRFEAKSDSALLEPLRLAAKTCSKPTAVHQQMDSAFGVSNQVRTFNERSVCRCTLR
jgi:hypothetical protein